MSSRREPGRDLAFAEHWSRRMRSRRERLRTFPVSKSRSTIWNGKPKLPIHHRRLPLILTLSRSLNSHTLYCFGFIGDLDVRSALMDPQFLFHRIQILIHNNSPRIFILTSPPKRDSKLFTQPPNFNLIFRFWIHGESRYREPPLFAQTRYHLCKKKVRMYSFLTRIPVDLHILNRFLVSLTLKFINSRFLFS